MNTIRIIASALLLTFAASALAEPTPVLIQPPSGQSAGDQTIKLQTSEGSTCATLAIGNCGSCSISCPTGKAASCRPGLAVGPQAAASCMSSPECKCN